jgi:hypothetical protein
LSALDVLIKFEEQTLAKLKGIGNQRTPPITSAIGVDRSPLAGAHACIFAKSLPKMCCVSISNQSRNPLYRKGCAFEHALGSLDTERLKIGHWAQTGTTHKMPVKGSTGYAKIARKVFDPHRLGEAVC